MTQVALRGDVRRGWWLASTCALVACAGILVAGLFTSYSADDPAKLGWDFRKGYFPAAELVAEGRSPYPADPDDPQPGELTLYHYSPLLAVLLAPLTRFPAGVVAVGAVLVSLVALLGALAVLGVRDLRCYAVVIIWQPGWNSLEMANVSALVALGAALVWRFRATLWEQGTVLGVLVALKFFLWPLAVWSLAMRRYRAAMLACVVGGALVLASWAVIGFAGVTTYPDLLSWITTQQSYSIEDMVQVLGLGAGAGRIASLIAGGVLLCACLTLARRGDDARAFIVAIAAALALTPIVWLHYLVLLAVPLGIARPRFSPIWLLPILLWVCPRSGNGDGVEAFLPAIVTLVVLLPLVWRSRTESVATVTA